jgi:hypothetical protein
MHNVNCLCSTLRMDTRYVDIYIEYLVAIQDSTDNVAYVSNA